MRVTAFAGPSLDAAERAACPTICWLPPAEAGDLLRLSADPPDAICLIDGHFDQRPAVRHKEILLLLSRGVRIYGASSIGALRAAEMDRYGMIGVGAIYAAYREGLIDGDDEVALLHAPAELDWQPLSVPLVDVRATLGAARTAGVTTRRQEARLIAAAAAIFYQERDWGGIVARAGWPPGEACTLLEWLDDHAVSQKTLDAHACITAALAANKHAPPCPSAVMPGFVDVLAQDCGLMEIARPQAQRETTTGSRRVVQRPGRGAGT